MRYQFAELLDRQAAITRRELEDEIEGERADLHSEKVESEAEYWERKNAELEDQVHDLRDTVDALTVERDGIQEKLENFEGDCYCGATVVEWHEMACKLQSQVDELEASAERGKDAYMRLPVDADGVPIRLGDTLVIERGGSTDIGEVSDIHLQEGECAVSICFEYDSGITALPKDYRHYSQPDTVESLLQDFYRRTWLECGKDGKDAVLAEYAERIRKAI